MRKFIVLLLLILLLAGCTATNKNENISQGGDNKEAQNEDKNYKINAFATYRANLERTGFYQTTAPKKLTEIVWKFTTNGKVDHLVIAGDMAYCGSQDEHIYAIDIKNGKKMWKSEVENHYKKSHRFSAADGVLYASISSYFYAFDAQYGLENWYKQLFDSDKSYAPVINEGKLYITTDNGISGYTAKNGQYDNISFNTQTYKDLSGSLSVKDGIAYIGGKDLYAVDLNDLSIKWSLDCGESIGPTVIDNDTLYFTSLERVENPSGKRPAYIYIPLLCTVDLATQKIKWADFRLGEFDRFTTVPALANNTIYIGLEHSDKGRMCAIDANTGQLKWSFDTPGCIYSSPSYADGMLFFGCNDNNLYSLDAENGKEMAKFRTDGKIVCDPVIHDGVVYFGSDDGSVYAVK